VHISKNIAKLRKKCLNVLKLLFFTFLINITNINVIQFLPREQRPGFCLRPKHPSGDQEKPPPPPPQFILLGLGGAAPKFFYSLKPTRSQKIQQRRALFFERGKNWNIVTPEFGLASTDARGCYRN
jgi:hypothetical protein